MPIEMKKDEEGGRQAGVGLVQDDVKMEKYVNVKLKKRLDVAGERMISVLETAVERIDMLLALPMLWKDISRGRTGQVERLLGPICASNMLRLSKLTTFHPSHGHQHHEADCQDGWSSLPSPSFMETTSRDDPHGGLLEGGHGQPGGTRHRDESQEIPWNQLQGQGGLRRKRAVVESLIDNHPSDFYFLSDLMHLRDKEKDNKVLEEEGMGGEACSQISPKFSILKLVKESLKSRYEDHVKKALGERDVKSLFCILSLVAGAKEDGSEQVEKLTRLMDRMWKAQNERHVISLEAKQKGRHDDDIQDAEKIRGQLKAKDGTKSGKKVKQIHKADCKRFSRMKISKRRDGDTEEALGRFNRSQIPPETLTSIPMYSFASQPRDDPMDTRSEFSKAWNPKYSYKLREFSYEQEGTEDTTTLDSEILAILRKDPSNDKEGKYQLPLGEAGNSLDNFESIIFDARSGRDSKDTQLSGVRDSYTFQNSLTTRRPTIADLPLTSTDTNKAKSSPSTTQTPSCTEDEPMNSTRSPSSSLSLSGGNDQTTSTESIREEEAKEIKKIFSHVFSSITNNVHLMRWIHARAGFDGEGEEEFERFKGLENVKMLFLQLIPLMQQKLITSLTHEMRLRNSLREKWKSLHRRARELESLQHEYIRLRKESRPVLLSLDFQIKILQSRLTQIDGENFDHLKEIIRETQLCGAIEEKGENLNLRNMEKNLRNLHVAAGSAENQIAEKRKQLVQTQDDLNNKLAQEIAHYDKRMFKVQKELDDAIEEGRQCKINVGKHQKQYEDIQNRFIDMKAEKKLKQILRHAQVADEMKRNKAAALIQATWRKYKIRKRKKERKRAKKGKKKQGKK